jgi:hypothetical protein
VPRIKSFYQASARQLFSPESRQLSNTRAAQRSLNLVFSINYDWRRNCYLLRVSFKTKGSGNETDRTEGH